MNHPKEVEVVVLMARGGGKGLLLWTVFYIYLINKTKRTKVKKVSGQKFNT